VAVAVYHHGRLHLSAVTLAHSLDAVDVIAQPRKLLVILPDVRRGHLNLLDSFG